MDSFGQIILLIELCWCGLILFEVLVVWLVFLVIVWVFQVMVDWVVLLVDVYVQGCVVMQVEMWIFFCGWKMIVFIIYDLVCEWVNVVLVLVIMGFVILLVGVFYLLLCWVWVEFVVYMCEFEDLCVLNMCLICEIVECEWVQKELCVVEQLVQQFSKLVVFGEMLVGVSYELNQLLVVMKIYFVGVCLFLQWGCGEEVLFSFQCIDDLVEWMGVIMWQLKFYVCKGGEVFELVDLCVVLFSVLVMMEL